MKEEPEEYKIKSCTALDCEDSVVCCYREYYKLCLIIALAAAGIVGWQLYHGIAGHSNCEAKDCEKTNSPDIDTRRF